MRIAILMLLTCCFLRGAAQPVARTYLQKSLEGHSVALEVRPDSSFYFYDARASSCFLWSEYKGTWSLRKDTLILSWKSGYYEEDLGIAGRRDTTQQGISIAACFDDGPPAAYRLVAYSCSDPGNPLTVRTDRDGRAQLPPIRCRHKAGERPYHWMRVLPATPGAHEYVAMIEDGSSNVFEVTIRRNSQMRSGRDQQWFLVRNGGLLYLGPYPSHYLMHWGDFPCAQ